MGSNPAERLFFFFDSFFDFFFFDFLLFQLYFDLIYIYLLLQDYVRSVTSYYAQLENERSRLSELAEIESTRKVEVVE